MIRIKIIWKINSIIELNKSKSKIISLSRDKQDITAVEILYEYCLKNRVKFLYCDLNYLDRGYELYIGQEVFIFQHPEGKSTEAGIGKIMKGEKNYIFEHFISTKRGSSGPPIILVYNERVVGINRGAYQKKEKNYGSFIGEILSRSE